MDKENEKDCALCNVSEETIKNLENAGSTKKEKYLLKKDKKDRERLSKDHKKKNKRIIKISVVSIISLLVIGGVAYGMISSSKSKISGVPKIEIISSEYDAGTVSMADGLVKHTYEVKNVGVGDLKIKNITTSCMCTTARFRDGNRIAPGETGYLEVVFDPNYHGPSGTGSLTRGIYFSTNDPENKNIEILLIIDVIK